MPINALAVETMYDLAHTLRGDLQHALYALENWMYTLQDAGVSDDAINPGMNHTQAWIALLTSRIDDLTSATLLTHDRLVVRPKRLHLIDLVHQAANEVAQAYEIPSDALTIGVDPDLPPAWCDPTLCVQVLRILIERAWKSTLPKEGAGRVCITVSHAEGVVVCAVSDTGKNIAPNILDELNAFTRDITTPEAGFGIGLTLCAGLLARSNGSLTATSPATEKGWSTTILISLPAAC